MTRDCLIRGVFSLKKSTKIIIIAVVSLVVLLVLGGLVWGRTWRMSKGNRLFKAADYKGAREIYADLSVDEPKSPPVRHNLGLAYYKENDDQKSLESLRQAVKDLEAVPDKDPFKKKLLGKFYYHLGDALFKNAAKAGEKQGQSNQPGQPDQQNQEAQQAGNFYLEALQNFQKAIEFDPGDEDAKYNYELTKLRLAEAQNQQQNKDNKDQQKQDQKQEEGKQGDQKEDQKKQEQNGQNKENQAKQDQAKEQQGRSGQSGQKKDGEMSKEEAAALLKMAENGDLYMGPVIIDKSPAAGKDW